MKKLLLILTGVILLTGCATFDLNDSQEVAIEIVARRIAYHVSLNNPDIIEPGIQYCNKALRVNDGPILVSMIQTGISYLEPKLADDPLLVQDLASLLKLINLDIDEATGSFDIGQLHFIVRAFQAGFEMAKAQVEV
jgi:hypothetical protein